MESAYAEQFQALHGSITLSQANQQDSRQGRIQIGHQTTSVFQILSGEWSFDDILKYRVQWVVFCDLQEKNNSVTQKDREHGKFDEVSAYLVLVPPRNQDKYWRSSTIEHYRCQGTPKIFPFVFLCFRHNNEQKVELSPRTPVSLRINTP
ncbi:hypothetical protein V8E54_003947, partial [Elaphomyces granulatus]